MAVTGGGNRKDLRPVEQRRGALGNHSRGYESLNVRNAQPGRNYFYESKNRNRILRSLNEGAHFVKDGEPEAVSLPPEEVPLSLTGSLGSLREYGDVVLMWRGDAVLRRQVEELLERNRAVLGLAEANYIQEGERLASEIGPDAGENPLYFVRPGRQHGIYVTEGEK